MEYEDKSWFFFEKPWKLLKIAKKSLFFPLFGKKIFLKSNNLCTKKLAVATIFLKSRANVKYFGMKIYFVSTGRLRKKLCWFFQLRKIYYHNKFSSQNNVPKYHPGRHEKDFRVCKKHYVERKKVVHPIYVLSYSISSRYSKRDDYYFISINYGTYYSSDFLWRSLYYWSTLM